MQDFILKIVGNVAETLDLQRDHVLIESVKDNLTIPRPRLELQFLPETYRRTGIFLGEKRTKKTTALKIELYEVTLPVAVLILAVDENWLKNFSEKFIKALKKNYSDKNGNYVRLTIVEGKWGGFAKKRVGLTTIDPLPKLERLLHLRVIYRVTEEKILNLLTDINFNPKWRDDGSK